MSIMESKIQRISHFQKLSPVNLQFQNVTYSIPRNRKESKLILQNVSGEFRSGQLTAILGSSGSGKTTLLNVLAGYKTVGANGTLMVNGRPFVFEEFRQLSRYIMQENLLQSFLTVQESMLIAAELKLKRELGQEERELVILEILEILRLTSAKDTLSNKLSGGERKRLSIALELINNPPVIFLDEPTTGLDDLSSSQCISLLKALADGGRTVICSIHTPSARIFAKFDNVYVMSEGMCVYQGYGRNVVSFLSDLGLSCPKHYNPADFVIEVSTGQYGNQYIEKMSLEIENGKNGSYLKDISRRHREEEIHNAGDLQEIASISLGNGNESFRQFKILLYRRWLQTCRNKQYLVLRIAASILMGIFLGSFYFDIGQDASKVLYNVSYFLITVMSYLYLTIMPISLYFPSEVKMLQREHFNKWYGLTAYYLAMTVATLPIHIVMILLSIVTSYTMSVQPMELDRFILVILICSLVTLVADSHGLLVATLFNVTNGVFVAPASIVPLVLVTIYGLGEGSNLPVVIRIATYFSYVRYGYEGFALAIYGNGRSYLFCPEEEIFCPLKDPKKIISYMGLQNPVIWINIIGLVIWFTIFRIISFYLLWLRLQANNPFKAVKYLIQNNLHSNKF